MFIYIYVVPRIDFDNHKPFEETTNEFLILERYLDVVSGSPKMLSLKNFSRVPKLKILQVGDDFEAF